VFVLPTDALTAFDAIHLSPELEGSEQALSISWRSPRIDGRFVLVLTPLQIYLRSGHDNPNPNYLYWLAPLSPAQFESARAFLGRTKDRRFERQESPRDIFWTPAFKEKKGEAPHYRALQRNLKYLLEKLGTALPAPKTEELKPRVRMVYLLDELR
jgi:hypothetical protein